MKKVAIAKWDDLKDRIPEDAGVGQVDLVVVRFDDAVSVFYGRCLHHGGLMSDGHVDYNDNLICGVHNSDYRLGSGVSEYENSEALPKFRACVEAGEVRVDADEVRDRTGGIPIGYKLSAQHIEKDVDAAPLVGADYRVLDGRGGGTGAARIIFHDNVSVPAIPALAQARRHLDKTGRSDVALIMTGGLRKLAEFAATQKPHLVSRLVIEKSVQRLKKFFEASIELLKVMAHACGHSSSTDFNIDDLTRFSREMADLSGVVYAGVAR